MVFGSRKLASNILTSRMTITEYLAYVGKKYLNELPNFFFLYRNIAKFDWSFQNSETPPK